MNKKVREDIRVLLSGESPGASAPPIVPNSPNDLLDPDLCSVAHSWNAKKRAEMAATFARWADQLILSAGQMDPSVGVDVKPPVAMPKNYFMVNLSQYQRDELYALAKESGLEIRHVMRSAVVSALTTLRAAARFARMTGIVSPVQRAMKFDFRKADLN